VETLVELLQRAHPSLSIELEAAEDDYLVSADPMRLEQAMMNVAVNASDAMPQGGTLKIGVERAVFGAADSAPLPDLVPGSWIRVSFADTGSGIAPELLAQVVEPFFTTKTSGEYKGLGLSQAYGLVQQHDGFLHIDTDVGEGTTVSIFLPALHVGGTESAAAGAPEPARGGGQSVLVVDGDEAMREALVETLGMLAYRSMEASNAAEALEILARGTPSINAVICDAHLPDMAEQELLTKLRETAPAVAVVMVADHTLESQVDELKALGLSAWVRKPPSLDRLAEVMTEILGR
jgi:CheY-like chemotaxis protein